MNTRLYFVRHAEAEGNIKRIFHGWTDSAITENGHIQAQELARRMAEYQIDLIVSSPLTRTLETAGYIAASKGLSIVQNEGLKEINGGEWENVPFAELQDKWPEHCRTWDLEPHKHVMPQGESMADFQQRVIDTVEEVIKEHKGKNICFVTHGTTIKTLVCYMKSLELHEMINVRWHENTALSIADFEDGVYNVSMEGDDSHLSDEISTIKKQGWQEILDKKIKEIK